MDSSFEESETHTSLFDIAWSFIQFETIILAFILIGLLKILLKRKRELVQRVRAKPGSKSAEKNLSRIYYVRWLQLYTILMAFASILASAISWSKMKSDDIHTCHGMIIVLSATFILVHLSNLMVLLLRAQVATKQKSRLFSCMYSIAKYGVFFGGPCIGILAVARVESQIIFNEYCTMLVPKHWGLLFMGTYVALSGIFLFLFCYPVLFYLRSMTVGNETLAYESRVLADRIKRNFVCSMAQILSSMCFQTIAMIFSSKALSKQPERRVQSLVFYSVDFWINMYSILAMTDVWIPDGFTFLRPFFFFAHKPTRTSVLPMTNEGSAKTEHGGPNPD